MAGIDVKALSGDFQRMQREHWAYSSETREGAVDCSGAFVWAYQQHGHDIYHGSNRMARVEVAELLPIKGTAIVPGMAAFKARQPGASGYALPASYKPGGAQYNGDLADYYHVGLVDEDTGQVLNARSTADGFVSSPITQGWTHIGYLKQVDYGGAEQAREPKKEGADAMAWMTVTAPSGSTVKLREKPTTSSGLYWEVPIGTVVEAGAVSGEWTAISWNGHKGYMMSKFLAASGVNAADGGATASSAESADLIERVAAVEGRIDSLEARVAELDGGLG